MTTVTTAVAVATGSERAMTPPGREQKRKDEGYQGMIRSFLPLPSPRLGVGCSAPLGMRYAGHSHTLGSD